MQAKNLWLFTTCTALCIISGSGLKYRFRRADIHIPTATGLFACANWMERETYDFFGILFDGHPNLTRILNIEEMDYFPMRKEYPLEDATREDKIDALFGR
jgi:NADH-quinone oxidoreductase subunit C